MTSPYEALYHRNFYHLFRRRNTQSQAHHRACAFGLRFRYCFPYPLRLSPPFFYCRIQESGFAGDHCGAGIEIFADTDLPFLSCYGRKQGSVRMHYHPPSVRAWYQNSPTRSADNLTDNPQKYYSGHEKISQARRERKGCRIVGLLL